jgi:hypothetical protein
MMLLVAFRVLARLWPREGRAREWPFCAKKVLTRPEQVLYYRLVGALPDYIVLAQVQLSRVLGVKRGFNFMAWNNRIDRLSLDFLVCLKDSTAVAAIELDDPSHDRPDRQEADARKAFALRSAGVRLVRWSTKALPDERAIREAMLPPAKEPVLTDEVNLTERIEPR